MEAEVEEYFPALSARLPKNTHFVNSESLLARSASPKEREARTAREFGAVFIFGVGGKLSDGQRHDGRAPDFDNWSTPTEAGFRGLYGDLVFWHEELGIPLELSSMEIRVDRAAQLALCSAEGRKELLFHSQFLKGELPLVWPPINRTI